MLVDTHFHLDLMDNMQSLIKEFNKHDVGIIAVGTTPLAYRKESQFTKGIENIKVGLGFHPQLISERSQEISLFLDELKNARYVGEIGLDFNSDFVESKSQQILILRKIVKECSNNGGKIISIHSVKSARCLVEILEEERTFETCKCVLHWFSGNASERKLAIEQGAYFSINSKMLKTKSGQDTIRSIPKDKILLETDAPFTIKINTAMDLKKELEDVARAISYIRNEDLFDQIEENSERIFKENNLLC